MTLAERIATTQIIDTHEHLIEESIRVAGGPLNHLFPCDDWAYLFLHYCADDLKSAGMPAADSRRFFAPEISTAEKYTLVAPYWERVRHTGYGQAVRRTLQGLYGEDDLTAESAPRLAEKYRALVQPGFYRTIFAQAGIERCQVNALERSFRFSEQPDLLQQDIGLPSLCQPDRARVEAEFGATADTLDGWLALIDRVFAECAPHAVAVKSQCAYWRRLHFEDVSEARATALFATLVHDGTLPGDDRLVLEDFLMRYCISKATEYGLPVKLHTGYYAGTGYMPLEKVGSNPADLCTLIQSFPDTTFVLMHIGWPYQDELLALAKHYPNVVIDLCWAWIINPAACVRFVREFLLTVPSSKLLTFGGDYFSVETIYGHAQVMRQGITEALTGLVADRWLREDEAHALIEPLLRGNANRLFPQR